MEASATSLQVYDFIQNIQIHLHQQYYKKNIIKTLCSNFNYKVFDILNIFNKNENSALDPRYQVEMTIIDIRNYRTNSQNVHFDFKQKLSEIALGNQYIAQCIGINWKTKTDIFNTPQKRNNYHYLIPEVLDGPKRIQDNICSFIGLNNMNYF